MSENHLCELKLFWFSKISKIFSAQTMSAGSANAKGYVISNENFSQMKLVDIEQSKLPRIRARNPKRIFEPYKTLALAL